MTNMSYCLLKKIIDTCNNYAVAICPAAGKSLKNAWQSEKILDFLHNLFF